MADNPTDVTSPEGDPLFIPLGLGALGLFAACLGRGLGPALPGAIVGFDGLVNLVLTSTAFVSQLFAIVGSTVSLRLALWLGTHRQLPFALKAFLGATCLFVCLVVFFSAQPRLFTVGPLVLSLLSLSSALLLLWSASMWTTEPETQSLVAICSASGLTALLHTGARLVALQASALGDGGRFDIARVGATLAAGFDLVLVLTTGWWLWRRITPVTKAWTSVALLCLPALFVGTPDAGPRYLLQRTIDALTSHPDPFLPVFVQWGLETLALVLAAACITDRRSARAPRLCVAFALLGRTTTDSPLGALFLVLSALSLLYPLVSQSMGHDRFRVAPSPR